MTKFASEQWVRVTGDTAMWKHGLPKGLRVQIKVTYAEAQGLPEYYFVVFACPANTLR